MLCIPSVSPGKADAKDLSISILLQRWPMSARQVWYALRRHGARLSYSAVYKALCELHCDQVLSRAGRGYLVNPTWLRRLCAFSHSAEMKLADTDAGAECARLVF